MDFNELINLRECFYNKSSLGCYDAFLKLKNDPKIRNKGFEYTNDFNCICCFYFLEYFKNEISEINYIFLKSQLTNSYIYIIENISRKYPVKTIKLGGIEQNNDKFLYSNRVLNKIYKILYHIIDNDHDRKQFHAIQFMKKYVRGDRNPMISKLTNLIQNNSIKAAMIALEFRKTNYCSEIYDKYFLSERYKYMIDIAKNLLRDALQFSEEVIKFARETNLFDNELIESGAKFHIIKQEKFNKEQLDKYLNFPLYSLERKIALQVDITNDLTTVENIICSDVNIIEINNWLFFNEQKTIKEMNNYGIFYLLLKMKILNNSHENLYILNNI